VTKSRHDWSKEAKIEWKKFHMSYGNIILDQIKQQRLFSLTYGMEAVIPVEIGMPTLRTAKVDMIKNDEALEMNLGLLEERREKAAI
nr:reverse transcriptase domain-containing protein [Tanacetum cinerariifolium]